MLSSLKKLAQSAKQASADEVSQKKGLSRSKDEASNAGNLTSAQRSKSDGVKLREAEAAPTKRGSSSTKGAPKGSKEASWKERDTEKSGSRDGTAKKTVREREELLGLSTSANGQRKSKPGDAEGGGVLSTKPGQGIAPEKCKKGVDKGGDASASAVSLADKEGPSSANEEATVIESRTGGKRVEEQGSKGRARKVPGSIRGGGKKLGRSASSMLLDGAKVRALLESEEGALDSFLEKYFKILDKNSDGSLSQDELRPALLRFGDIVGMPPAGTAAAVDERVEEIFNTVFATHVEVDMPTFVNVSRNFLTAIADGLRCRPLVVQVYDSRVLHELAENEELFDCFADDFFTEFDRDRSDALTRDEIEEALVALGLVPPAGSRPEVDALLARILGKYAGADLELQRDEFRKLLKDLLRDLAGELADTPPVYHTEVLPVLNASDLRGVARDPARLRSFGDAAFEEWDTLKTGRLGLGDIQKGLKELFKGYKVELGETELEPTMQLFKCLFHSADVDDTGFVERDEFDKLLAEALQMLADRLKDDTSANMAASMCTAAAWMADWFYTSASGPVDAGAVDHNAHGAKPAPETVQGPEVPGSVSVKSSSPPLKDKGEVKKPGKNVESSVETQGPPSVRNPAANAKASAPTVAHGRARSAADVKAKYNYEASEAVLRAREKLEQRQQKLREVGDKAQELNDESALFAELGAQLAEKMKNRWW